MKVVRDLAELHDIYGSVVTDGMFDGMHLGHQGIIQKLVAEARAKQLPAILLTYWPHPRHVLPQSGNERLKLLTSIEEKTELAEGLGIDYMVILQFTPLFSQLSHEDFVQQILVNGLKTKQLIIGYDHRFGNKRGGDVQYLRQAGAQAGFSVMEIGQQEVEEIAVSSTKIRYALQHHKIETAATFLGRNYSLTGKVIHGDKRGRQIGFPTANLGVDFNKMLPADGVYATITWRKGKSYTSMTNIGFRPTVDGKKHCIETHILDFDQDIYGENLKIEFVSLLRMEKRFTGVEALRAQLEQDRLDTRNLF